MNALRVGVPGRAYDVLTGSGLLERAGPLCRAALPRAGRIAVVTDTTVAPLYAKTVLQSLQGAGIETCLIAAPPGEGSKSLGRLGSLYDALLDFGLTRTDAVAALGGGVVGDLAGFAAATVLRGIPFVQMPTTLLAQVDSSVGGKVAINATAGKNLIGAFWQPSLVIMDTDCLNTLSDTEFAAGMAEVIKYGCISDAEFFEFLEANPSRGAVMAHIGRVVTLCCDRKRAVVEEDERDTGARMSLNFGHTLGHAYELAGGYERWSHGQAVAAGMCRAAALGTAMGVTPAGTASRIAALLEEFGLPTSIPCTAAEYAAAIGLDKKGSGDEIALILLSELGRSVTVRRRKAEVLALLGEDER